MDILLIVLFSLTVVCIEGQPILVISDLIQDEPGSVTCTTDDGTVGIYNKAYRVTYCLVTSTSCIFESPSITNWTGIYTLTKGETTVGSNTFSVTVNILQVSTQRDGGLWTCRGFGVSNVTKTIDVKVPVSSVTVQPTNSVFIDRESNAISCIPSGTPNPLPTFKWYKDGQLLSETTSTLNCLADKDDDGKILLCSADNSYSGTKISQLILDIKFPVPDVTLDNKTNLIFINKQSVSVTCKTGVSNPSATVTWFIDGNVQATSSVTTTPNSDGTTTSILQLNTHKSYNNKIIQCTAYNGYGESQTDSGSLTVQYLDPMVIFTDKTQVEEGGRINITCSTNSYPVASIIWSKESQLIQVKKTNKGSYIKEEVSCLDTGDYSCSASNTAFTNSVSKSRSLIVKCSPRQDPRVTPIRTITGNITDGVNLVADVISFPPPSFTWYYIEDNMVIYISNKNPFKQIDTTLSTNTYKSTLTINITSKLLYRTYRVNASNDDGSFIIFNYSVVTQSRPHPPYQLATKSQSNNQICVEWKPGFNGRANQTVIVQHSTDDNTWVDSSPIPDRNDGQLIQYCITDLEPETQYYMRMAAKNKFGESQVVYFRNCFNSVKTFGEKGEESSKGRASGIGIGIGISVGVVLLVLLAFIVYRRLITGKQKGSNADENYSTLNRGTTSGDPQTYQELNDVRTYENLGRDNNRDSPYVNT